MLLAWDPTLKTAGVLWWGFTLCSTVPPCGRKRDENSE